MLASNSLGNFGLELEYSGKFKVSFGQLMGRFGPSRLQNRTPEGILIVSNKNGRKEQWSKIMKSAKFMVDFWLLSDHFGPSR